jgi:hypothetical protein
MSRPAKQRAMPFGPEHDHLYTDPIFLIGNGASRKDFDLKRLRGRGTIIGCNALYRDFTPDLLVSIDTKMINEIRAANYFEDNLLLVPANRNAQVKGVLKWRTDRFNTSGCFAMKLITQILQPEKCYMLGMDAYRGNVYDKTQNYAVNSLANFNGVKSFYMQELKCLGDTVFINVNETDAWPPEAAQTGRYKFITYEEFEDEVFPEKRG